MNDADQILLAKLASLLRRCDPVPDSAYTAAEAAFALASLEDGWELLALIPDPVLVRSGTRSFSFRAKEIRLDIGLTRSPWGVCLNGLVSPVSALEVHWPTGMCAGHPDATGFFRMDDLPDQPLRIRLRSHVTPWFWP